MSMTDAGGHDLPVKETIERLDPSFELDGDGRLSESVACRDCGYDLRGMQPDDRCPECGLEVGASMRSDLLGHMQPAWLKRLRYGLAMLFVSLALGIVGGVLLGVVGAAVAAASAASGMGSGSVGVMMVMGVSMLALQVVVCGTIWLVGVFVFTSAEPAGRREGDVRPVKMARLGEVASYALSLIVGLIVALQMTGGVGGFGVAGTSTPQAVMSVLATLTGVVSFAGLFFYGSRLFLRVPTGRLARQAQRVAWGVLVFGTVGAVGEAGQAISHASGAQPASAPQASQAQSGAAVSGGQSQTTQHTNADGSVVETTVTTFPDGSTLTEAATRSPSGTVTQTSTTVSSSSVSFGNSQNAVVLVVQLVGGVGLVVVSIWGLVLSILLYRRLNEAIQQAVGRLAGAESGQIAGV